eukprot:4606098-Alexandrium_andersonii.AAC.1
MRKRRGARVRAQAQAQAGLDGDKRQARCNRGRRRSARTGAVPLLWPVWACRCWHDAFSRP